LADIKPENILLHEDGHCKLGDFALDEIGIFKGKKTIDQCGTELYTFF
jgi:serine/threonine protein kinase